MLRTRDIGIQRSVDWIGLLPKPSAQVPSIDWYKKRKTYKVDHLLCLARIVRRKCLKGVHPQAGIDRCQDSAIDKLLAGSVSSDILVDLICFVPSVDVHMSGYRKGRLVDYINWSLPADQTSGIDSVLLRGTVLLPLFARMLNSTSMAHDSTEVFSRPGVMIDKKKVGHCLLPSASDHLSTLKM
jgi:hypothetical protein